MYILFMYEHFVLAKYRLVGAHHTPEPDSAILLEKGQERTAVQPASFSLCQF